MGSSSSSDTSFKCDDCSQELCPKHALEHRQTFMDKMDKMIFEHETLQHTFYEHQDQYHLLTEKIDRWERESKDRIQRTADEVRQQVKTFIRERTKLVSNELHHLADNLRNAPEDDSSIQLDLQTCTNKMEKLNCDLSSVSSSFSILEDPNQTLVTKIYLSQSTPEFVHNESLVTVSNNYDNIDSGRTVIRTDLWGNVSVRSKGEYSLGIHKCRFIIGTKNSLFSTQFGIVSKFAPRSQAFSAFSGWEVNDCLDDSDGWERVMNPRRNMDEETTFEIELTIDCHNQMIYFLNERTKHTREKHIDTLQCPFPWHLCFYLDNDRDRVQLVSSVRAC